MQPSVYERLSPRFTGLSILFAQYPGLRRFAASPRAMCCRPVYTGLLNSAHLRFAIQLYKLELVRKNRQGTNYDRQVVEHGDCVAYSVAGATVHAPGFASRYARLLRRDRQRLKARAVATAKLLREGVVSADTKPPATLRRKPRNMSLVYRNSVNFFW